MFHDHQNPLEPEYSSMDREERDAGFYETGNTRPPKRGGGLLAGLLIAAIILGSFVVGLASGDEPEMDATEDTGETSELDDSYLSTHPTTAPEGNTDDPGDGDQRKDSNQTNRHAEELVISSTPESVDNPTQDGGLSLQEIYKKVNPSTVSITASTVSGTDYGSGIIMTDSGYIITNCHVIDGAASFSVTLHNGHTHEAELVGKDVTSDLAVLRIDAKGLVAAEFGDSEQVQVGDIAVAIGDPLGLELRGTMTAGIISAINRNLTIEGRDMTLLQTTAALNEGNSGGPLINCYGQVIGINTIKVGNYYNSGVEGLGFAIPINTAKEIIDQLIAVGYVPGRVSLGVETMVLDYQYRAFFDLPEGLYITYVDPDSNAWELGLQKGDTIISVGGQNVTSQEELNSVLAGCEAGQTVEIVIYRNRQPMVGKLMLEEASGDS